LLGFPVLRLRGDYLAIVTLGFGEIVRIFVGNLNITNGPQGINMLDSLKIFGWDLSRNIQLTDESKINSLVLYYYAFLLFVVASVIIIRRLQISRIGRGWAAIRDDELAAKAIGINTRNMKLLAFAMGATFGGVAGGLFGAFQGFVSPESFTLLESIAVLTMVVFGGMGNLGGVILGAIALSILPEVLRQIALPMQQAIFGRVLLDPEVLRMLLLSLAMIFMMLVRPAGILPAHARYSRPEWLRDIKKEQA
jgi:branched-chain amino acid transport system permease protein